MRILFAVFLGAVLAVLCNGQEERNPCALGLLGVENLDGCLRYIKEVVYDESRFFFGSDYEERCSGVDTVDCFNPFESYNNSIGSLLFGENSNLDDLNSFLYIKYESDPITYRGCGTNVTVPRKEFYLDMSLREHLPVTTRDAPVEMYYDADDEEFYTMLILDVGFGFIHGAVLNIPGNNILGGDFIDNYSPMLNFRFTPNPYVFLIFRQQNDNIRLNNAWQRIFEAGSLLGQVPSFMDDHNLRGPVALNIVVQTTDIWAISNIQRFLPESVQNCGAFVTKALNLKEEEFLPENLTLLAYLEVAFQSMPNRFRYCCDEHVFRNRTVHVDPIGDRIISSSDVRTGTRMHFNITPNTIFPRIAIWEDADFTAVIVDSDVANPMLGDEERPFIHYFAYNLRIKPVTDQTGKIVGGRQLVEWRGPAPPPGRPHRYYIFLMGQQPNAFRHDRDVDLESYLGDNCEGFAEGRCRFEIARFAQEKDLSLVGASWFRVRNDDWVNYNAERPESREVCGNRYPCPTPPPPEGASALHVSTLLLAVTSAVAYLKF